MLPCTCEQGFLLDLGRNPFTWICVWLRRQGALTFWNRNRWFLYAVSVFVFQDSDSGPKSLEISFCKNFNKPVNTLWNSGGQYWRVIIGGEDTHLPFSGMHGCLPRLLYRVVSHRLFWFYYRLVVIRSGYLRIDSDADLMVGWLVLLITVLLVLCSKTILYLYARLCTLWWSCVNWKQWLLQFVALRLQRTFLQMAWAGNASSRTLTSSVCSSQCC